MDLQETKNQDGTKGSPTLPEHIKNYLIDIDGTICEDIPNEEPDRMWTAAELPGARETITKWYNEGNIITFFTSRVEAHREATEHWLKEHNFPYHGIVFGKPRGGNYHWIDDRTVKATKFEGNFGDMVQVERKIWVFEK